MKKILGAGKGYLSQCLNFVCNLEVISIDSSSFHSENAEKRKEYILQKNEKEEKRKKIVERENKKLKIEEEKKKLKILTKFISPKMSEKEFNELVFPHLEKEKKEVLITSLHSCGDLSTSSMKMANNFDSIKAFVGVGCCYHKVSALNDPKMDDSSASNPSIDHNPLNPSSIDTLEQQKGKIYSFPFSQYCIQNNIHLNPNALQTACQPIDQYPSQRNVDQVFKKHFYRSLLQKVLVREKKKKKKEK